MCDLFLNFLIACDYQIKESDNFNYPMYPNSRYMAGSTDNSFGSLGIHFNSQTREIYEIIANTEGNWKGDHVAYRWMHPDYREAARMFYSHVGDPDLFCNGEPYVDLEDAQDCLDKGQSLLQGNLDYDRRIVIALDVTEEEADELRHAAKRRGITLDQFVEEALIQVIAETDPISALQFRNEGLGDPNGSKIA